MRKRTKQQNIIIHAAKRASGISEENYRAAICAISNGRTETSAELSFDEANELITRLNGRPVEQSKRARQYREQKSGVTKLVTPEQIKPLRALAAERWGVEQAGESLRAFCASPKVINKPRPHTSKEAQKCIEVLKAMIARDQKEAA